MNNEYYIGLDMGTNSVGWAVTDTKYKLLRAKGKDMWGVRLFDEAQTAAERRLYRVARRRRQREVARIGVLKELFEDAIAEVDPGFYHRLEESKYYEEDRSADNQQKFALFNDGLFTDKEYYDQYPTIFHLRKELIESTEPHDVRLVYLAVLNLFKRRGHFLNKGLDLSDSGSDMAAAYQTLLDEAEYQEIYFPQSVDPVALEQCLSERGLSRKGILENATQLLGINKKSKNEKPAYELLTMICGLKGTLAKIFGEEVLGEDNKKFSFSFRDSDYEEKAVEAVELIGEEAFALLAAAKEVHDIGLLAHILAGEKYLSMARVNQYNAHKADLYQLKYVLKKYDRHAYHEMFRTMSDNNYSAYVGSVNYKETKVRRNGGKGKSSDDFLKNLKKVLGKLPSAAHEDPDVQEIFDKIEVGDFLPKQLTGENGIIPNQVHARELKVILDNAAGYLPFLNEVDESGLTVAERILALFTFQIPYYVGPLGQQHAGEKGYNVWAKRRPGQEKGRILPWNFEEKIDTHQAAEDFILRMVRHCTYLQEESTLPKQSLLYEKFMVLNELNNLKINGEKPSIEVKQGIYTDLFETGKRVTGKKLLEYLRNRGLISSDETSTSVLSGIDGDFKASLSSLEKFRGVFGEDVKKDSVKEMIEQIIFWGTVFGDDKKFIRARLAEHYGDVLSSQQIKCISGMKFAGWGNLSREFLLMEGASKADGEYRALIDALWNTSDNLMELLSDRYTYKDVLHQRMQIAEKPLSEWTVEDLDGLYLSPSVRRMVWQTLKVLREVTAIQGGAPTRVFVEMARDDAQTQQRNKGKRSESRKAFLSALYKDDKEWVKFIDSHEERDFRIRKLYLYALQRGKCMYSGETIDIDNLMSDNSRYDIDHIYPQHFIKDDSLVNNLVLVKKEINNAGKGGHYPIAADIRQRMLPHWKHLKDINAISDEKYNRLRRSAPMTDEELAGFINRQIVETRQGTKAITQILQQAFPGEEVKVVFTKAGVASQFRQEFDITKVRSINDLHHAHDAYLNIIAGNVYNAKFTDNPYNFIRKAEKGKNYTYHMDKVFRGDVYRGNDLVWQAASKEAGTSGTIAFVKAQLDRKTVLITRRSYMVHGGITGKATIWSKEKANPEAYLPVKSSDPRLSDVTKYGGVTAIANAAYALVEYEIKGKVVRSLEGVPIYLQAESKDDPVLAEYLWKKIQLENKKKTVDHLEVKLYPVRQRSLVRIDGYYYYLAGAAGDKIYLINAVPVYLEKKWVDYIKVLEKAISREAYGTEDNKARQVVTPEQNDALYTHLLGKFITGIFAQRKASIMETIASGQQTFGTLDAKDQCFILSQIINWMNTSTQTVDLTLIGGSKHAGMLTVGKKISNCNEAILIEQSVTGLYERRINLKSL